MPLAQYLSASKACSTSCTTSTLWSWGITVSSSNVNSYDPSRKLKMALRRCIDTSPVCPRGLMACKFLYILAGFQPNCVSIGLSESAFRSCPVCRRLRYRCPRCSTQGEKPIRRGSYWGGQRRYRRRDSSLLPKRPSRAGEQTRTARRILSMLTSKATCKGHKQGLQIRVAVKDHR